VTKNYIDDRIFVNGVICNLTLIPNVKVFNHTLQQIYSIYKYSIINIRSDKNYIDDRIFINGVICSLTLIPNVRVFNHIFCNKYTPSTNILSLFVFVNYGLLECIYNVDYSCNGTINYRKLFTEFIQIG
jgi:hypothetical protein